MNDPERVHSREQGHGIAWTELFLALACFFGTLLWANTAGGWIRLSRRVIRWLKRWRANNKKFYLKPINPSNNQIP